jgi:hypothetical protein
MAKGNKHDLPVPKAEEADPIANQADESKKRFREFWDAVLRGEHNAQLKAYEYIRQAVAKYASRRPDISTDSLAHTVARTLLRRAENMPGTLEVSDLDHFRNLARKFGRNKLSNATRKRDRYEARVGSLPMSVDDQGESRPLDPTDESTMSPVEQAILDEWSEAFIEAIESLPEPKLTIMRTALEVASQDTPKRSRSFIREVHESLIAKGVDITEAALRMRIRRVGDSIEAPPERGL